jgi:photosystem I subunit 2
MQSATVSQPMPSHAQFMQPLGAEAAKAKKEPTKPPPPFSPQPWLDELNQQLKDPEATMIKFQGGTGGLNKKAFIEEMYIMTWNAPKEALFEMPTGGTAMMNSGQNMIYQARKEHCLALGTRLRKMKIKQYRIFRRFPTGEIQFLHPADGVFPETVNAGRVGANQKDGGIVSQGRGVVTADIGGSPTR